MVFPVVSRRFSLRMLLVSAVLAVAVPTANAAAALQPGASPAITPADWMRDYTPAHFRQLMAPRGPIDPANFSEPLLAAAIFEETNQQRADLHLPAFAPDESASHAARLHARWMAGTHVLSHDEPSGRGTPVTSLDRLVRQGLRPHAAAENIAYNLLPDITPGKPFYTHLVNGQPVYSYQPDGHPSLRAHTYDDFARAIVAQWMRSPLHRANIVNPEYRFLGVGVALAHRRGHPDTIYGAQEFFTPRVPPLPPSMISHAETTLLPPRP